MNLAEFFGKIGLQALVEELPINKHPLQGRARSVFGVITTKALSAKSLSRELSKEDLEKLAAYDPKRLPGGALEMAAFATLVKKTASFALKEGALPEKAVAVVAKASTVSIDSKTFDFSKRENRGILEHTILSLRGQIEDEKAKLSSLEAELRKLQAQELDFQQKDLKKLEAEKVKAEALAKVAWAQQQIDAIESGAPLIEPVVSSPSVRMVRLPNKHIFYPLSQLVLTNQPVSTNMPAGLRMGVQTLNNKIYNECSLSPKVSGNKDPKWMFIQNHLVSLILLGFIEYYEESGESLEGQFGQTNLSHTYYKIVSNHKKDFSMALLEYYEQHAKPQLAKLTESSKDASSLVVWDFLIEYALLREDILIQLPVKNSGLSPEDFAKEVNKFASGFELDKLFKPEASTIIKIIESDSPIKELLLSKYAVSAFHKIFLRG